MNDYKKRIYPRIIKRLMDVVLSLIAILVLSPIIVIISLMVKNKLGNPVFFKQERPGLNENIFLMYKFRTMTNRKDKDGELLSDQERITKFGKMLRSTSLDELPSLFNILRGEMSIVGPRPLLIRYLPYYSIEEKKRHCVRPGLTGLAQVSGRNVLNWNDRLKLDVIYVNNVSLLMDCKIIFLTAYKVIQRKDIVVGDQHVLKSLDVERSVKKWK